MSILIAQDLLHCPLLWNKIFAQLITVIASPKRLLLEKKSVRAKRISNHKEKIQHTSRLKDLQQYWPLSFVSRSRGRSIVKGPYVDSRANLIEIKGIH